MLGPGTLEFQIILETQISKLKVGRLERPLLKLEMNLKYLNLSPVQECQNPGGYRHPFRIIPSMILPSRTVVVRGPKKVPTPPAFLLPSTGSTFTLKIRLAANLQILTFNGQALVERTSIPVLGNRSRPAVITPGCRICLLNSILQLGEVVLVTGSTRLILPPD